VDLAWDLDRFPWPVLDDSFHLLIASHVMEHVRDFGGFLAECYRITAPGGVLVVRCPHFSCRESFRNPTHVRHLTFDAMQEMLSEGPERYRHDLSCTRIPFRLTHTQLTFRGRTRARIGRFLARRKIRIWEQYWSRIFPAREVCWVLRKAAP
jgi:SAM-dependent methyltransferase